MTGKTILRASGKPGRSKSLGAAIAGALESGQECVDVELIGAAAMNNAMKAIAIANIMLQQDQEQTCVCVPEFERRTGQRGEYTAMVIHVRR